MKAGFYSDELENIGSEFCSAKDAANWYADEKHQIDEESDMCFEVYVKDDEGVLRCYSMKTEWEPNYFVNSVDVVTPK